MLSHSEVITFKMTLTRSKRIAEEPLLTLSAAKKKRMNVTNVGNNLDTERFEEAPETNAPVNFVENVFQESLP